MRLHLFNDRRRFRLCVNAYRKNDQITTESLHDCLGQCSLDRKSHPLDIWLYVGPTGAALAHELYHAVEYVREFVGIEAGFDSSEPSAYLFDYLFSKCSDAMAEAAA